MGNYWPHSNFFKLKSYFTDYVHVKHHLLFNELCVYILLFFFNNSISYPFED